MKKKRDFRVRLPRPRGPNGRWRRESSVERSRRIGLTLEGVGPAGAESRDDVESCDRLFGAFGGAGEGCGAW